jgi:hypothetical protein
MGRLIDITNQRFGRWVAHRHLDGQLWACICDCGTERAVDSSRLRAGKTKSCGCLKRDLTAVRSARDIAGLRFGLLTALSPTLRRSGNNVVWRFECTCGRIVERVAAKVVNGETKSCGCLRSRVSSAKGRQTIRNAQRANKKDVCKHGHPRHASWGDGQSGRGCPKCKICVQRKLPYDTDEAVLGALLLIRSFRKEVADHGVNL